MLLTPSSTVRSVSITSSSQHHTTPRRRVVGDVPTQAVGRCCRCGAKRKGSPSRIPSSCCRAPPRTRTLERALRVRLPNPDRNFLWAVDLPTPGSSPQSLSGEAAAAGRRRREPPASPPPREDDPSRMGRPGPAGQGAARLRRSEDHQRAFTVGHRNDDDDAVDELFEVRDTERVLSCLYSLTRGARPAGRFPTGPTIKIIESIAKTSHPPCRFHQAPQPQRTTVALGSAPTRRKGWCHETQSEGNRDGFGALRHAGRSGRSASDVKAKVPSFAATRRSAPCPYTRARRLHRIMIVEASPSGHHVPSLESPRPTPDLVFHRTARRTPPLVGRGARVSCFRIPAAIVSCEHAQRPSTATTSESISLSVACSVLSSGPAVRRVALRAPARGLCDASRRAHPCRLRRRMQSLPCLAPRTGVPYSIVKRTDRTWSRPRRGRPRPLVERTFLPCDHRDSCASRGRL